MLLQAVDREQSAAAGGGGDGESRASPTTQGGCAKTETSPPVVHIDAGEEKNTRSYATKFDPHQHQMLHCQS